MNTRQLRRAASGAKSPHSANPWQPVIFYWTPARLRLRLTVAITELAGCRLWCAVSALLLAWPALRSPVPPSCRPSASSDPPEAPSAVRLSVSSSSSLRVEFEEPLCVNSAVVTKYKGWSQSVAQSYKMLFCWKSAEAPRPASRKRDLFLFFFFFNCCYFCRL